MSWRAMAAWGLICAAAGCCTPAEPPPFQASWFLQGPLSGQRRQSMYVLLVNQSHKPQTVTDVIINPSVDQSGKDRADGWRLAPSKIVLAPGDVLVRHIEDFEKGGKKADFLSGCQIPADILVRTEQAPDGVAAEVTGLMPSSLPYAWETECPKP